MRSCLVHRTISTPVRFELTQSSTHCGKPRRTACGSRSGRAPTVRPQIAHRLSTVGDKPMSSQDTRSTVDRHARVHILWANRFHITRVPVDNVAHRHSSASFPRDHAAVHTRSRLCIPDLHTTLRPHPSQHRRHNPTTRWRPPSRPHPRTPEAPHHRRRSGPAPPQASRRPAPPHHPTPAGAPHHRRHHRTPALRRHPGAPHRRATAPRTAAPPRPAPPRHRATAPPRHRATAPARPHQHRLRGTLDRATSDPTKSPPARPRHRTFHHRHRMLGCIARVEGDTAGSTASPPSRAGQSELRSIAAASAW
jgi:hypothetical protein